MPSEQRTSTPQPRKPAADKGDAKSGTAGAGTAAGKRAEVQSKKERKVLAPAIMDYTLSDLLSLAICGYIGGRFMFLNFSKYARGGVAWYVYGVAIALITSYGGGSYYVFMMKDAKKWAFGWQDPLSVIASLIGYAISLWTMDHCSSWEPYMQTRMSGMTCANIFSVFDHINNAILIAWGVSKAYTDTVGESNTVVRLAIVLCSCYTYSFGGGITRDVLAILLGTASSVDGWDSQWTAFQETVKIGNFSHAVVIPYLASAVLYYVVLARGSSRLVQLACVGYIYAFYFSYDALIA